MSRKTAQTSRAASQAGMIVASPMMAATISPITSKARKTSATPKNAPATPSWLPLRLSFDLGQGNLVIELPRRQFELEFQGLWQRRNTQSAGWSAPL